MTIFLLVGGLAVLLTALGTVSSRMLVRWPRPWLVKILHVSSETVTLQATPLTTYEGVYGLRSPRAHARVGEVIARDAATVTRVVLDSHGDLRSAGQGTFDGDVHYGPGEIASYSTVEIQTEGGIAPAWQFDSEVPSDLWIIHIHGYQADRLNALRTVDVLIGTPATHLVVSYRGDGEGPATPNGTTRLGLDEWRDVDAALKYAAREGARRVLLVGWSMGAAISLLLEERSSLKALIVGNIFVSPTTDWRATMATSARRMRIPFPKAVAGFTTAFLSSKLTSRLAGVEQPIDFEALDWTRGRRVTVPTLVLHSIGDLTVPIQATRAFARANAPLVDLVELQRAPHTREYNVSADVFTATVRDWLSGRL